MSRATNYIPGGDQAVYQALYRKWRPKVFDDVIGQEHITETLKTQVKTGHLSHAYIFIGTRGTGKTTCARILAKAVNCESPINGNPCNQCKTCRGIDDGSILDIVELDAASNTGVDNVRDLKEEAVFSPAAAKKRVYIIDEVHMLSLAAFNALLKIIEEPPSHLMFILATTELQKVPATILSRCQRHSFRRIPTQRLAAYLGEIARREKLQLDESAAMQIGRLAEGGVRDALSILDQCSGKEHITTETVFETMGLAGNRNLVLLLQQVLQHDSAQALQLFQKIWLDGKEPASFLGELNGLIRDIMIVKAAPAGAGELISGNYERDILDSFAAKMTKEEVLYCADTLQDAIARIRQVRNPRTVAELCIVSLCDSRTAESILSLRARVSRLEEILKSGIIPVQAQAAEETMTATVIATPQLKPLDRAQTQTEGPGTEPFASPQERQSIPIPEITLQEPAELPRNPEPVIDGQKSAGTEIPAYEHIPQKPAYDASASETEERKAVSADRQVEIEQILEQAKAKLPIEIRFSVGDPEKIRIELENQDLILEALPGFLLERLKKPENRAVFSAAAETVLGHPVAVRLAELKKENRAVRDINELRKFKEITFIS